MRIKGWLIFCLLITFSTLNTLRAQVINGNNWFFGNSSQALIFKKSDNEVTIEDIQATPFGDGGSLVISDERDGNWIFYTDGTAIYDATHTLLPDGAGLTADPSLNQAVAAAPRPGSLNTQWFIFTNSGTSGVNEIQYTRVDREIQGNATQTNQPSLGDVFMGEKNVSTGLVNPSPGMLVIRSSIDNSNFWLLSQESVTQQLRVTEISPGVIGNTQLFTDATAPAIIAENFSSVRINQDSARIAISPQNTSTNVQIWILNLATGALNFERQILNTGNADDVSPSIYDTEWSLDGTKLYISRQGSSGTTGDLYQFDFQDTLENVNSVLPNPIFRSYGVKLGPNDTLYHLYQSAAGAAIQLGAVQLPGQVIDSVEYNDSPLPTAALNGRQFPEQAIPNMATLGVLNFSFLDSCFSLSTKFTPEVDIPPAFYFWDFGDGNTSFAHSPVHTYDAAGAYQVSMTVFLNGVTETFTRTVQIIDTQLQLNLFMDSTICPGDTVLLDPMPDPATSALSYIWSTGETTPTIQVDSTGTYWVAVEAADPNTGGPSGCFIYAETNILVYEDTIQVANQWYFGDMAGIDFNENPPVALLDGVSQSPEAAATISDINGDLLFYTNGTTVYNKDHVVMVNGTDIGGDSTSAQGALIVQLPMDETIFYIFMTDPAWEDETFDVRYSIVDMKNDSARGSVELKNRPLYRRATERMTASGAGDLVWLVTHEFGNNTFRSYPIDENGIGQATFSSEGTILSPATEGNSRNSMKLAANLGKLAMTIAGPENFVEVFDFVDSTGEVMNPLLINLQEPAPAEVYSVEFSADTTKLYVTTRNTGGGTSRLLQYDLDSADVEASKFIIAEDAQQFGTLQTGPNGVIYMAVDGSTDLGTINSPNANDANVGFTLAGFNLGGRISTLGLPNFVQNQSQPPQGPSITVGPGCRGQTIQMSATGTSNIDEFFWTFGDGQSAAGQDTSHVYNVADDYTVTVRITNVCGLDTLLRQDITISDDVPRPTVPGATAICDQTLTLDAYDGNPGLVSSTFRYNWSTGDTTQTISVSVPSTILVSVTDIATGCVSDTVTVLVGDGRPQVDLGPPQTVCAGTDFNPLDAGNPGASYAWTINGVAAGSGRFQTVNASVAGVFDYGVSVTDPLTGCTGTSSVLITVNELPDFTIVPNQSSCGNADGSLDVTAVGSSTYSYTLVSSDGSLSTSGTLGSGGVFNIPNLPAGNYSATFTDQVTNCVRTLSTNITDSNAPFGLDLTTDPDCGSDGDLVLNGFTGVAPATYDWELLDDAANVLRSGNETNLNLNDLDTGVYNLTIQSTLVPTPCLAAAQVTLSELPPATITVDPIYNFCGGQGTIPASVVTGGSVTWTFPDGSVAVIESLVVTQSGTYTATSSGVGLCPRTETVEVIISQDPEVNIEVVGDQCEGMLTLNATSNVSGASSFVWGSSDANNGAVSSSIIVMQSGTYSVTTRDQSTGCLGTASVDVIVEPVLELFITAEPDCDNNPSVFLNAESNITADVIFEWTDPFGNILPDSTATIAVDTSGVYSARVIRINSGCDASASFNITVEPIDDEDLVLPERAIICPLDPSTASTILNAGTFSTYEWRLIPDETIIATTQTLEVFQPGQYEVTVFNGSTCTRDVVNVIEDCTPRIFAPNAFTPNGDGLNDNFFVFNNPFVTEFSIWIYNRWGELVFQADNLDFRWDGMFRGEFAPVGTYAWVARFRSSVEPELGEIEEHGGVTLIR